MRHQFRGENKHFAPVQIWLCRGTLLWGVITWKIGCENWSNCPDQDKPDGDKKEAIFHQINSSVSDQSSAVLQNINLTFCALWHWKRTLSVNYCIFLSQATRFRWKWNTIICRFFLFIVPRQYKNKLCMFSAGKQNSIVLISAINQPSNPLNTQESLNYRR